MLTEEDYCMALLEDFMYNPGTGIFTRIKSGGNQYSLKGSIAESISDGGYVTLDKAINGERRRLQVHRVAFWWVHGYLPKIVDHKNHIKTWNAIKNLRASDASKNHMNQLKRSDNTSDVIGVNWNKKVKKWEARIGFKGRRIGLGFFKTKGDAMKARTKAEEMYHKEHSLTNSIGGK